MLERVPVRPAHRVRAVPAAARPELARARQVLPGPARERQDRPEREQERPPEARLVQVAEADTARGVVARVVQALMAASAAAAAAVVVAIVAVAANSSSDAPNLPRRRM